MMGRLEGGSAKLFYEFSLEEMVPQNHLLRGQVFFIAVHRSGLLWARLHRIILQSKTQAC